MRRMIRSLNILYQESLFKEVFSSSQKHAVVILSYKGHDCISDALSFRPINLCCSLDKVLEKIVNIQILTLVSDYNSMHDIQHGFFLSKSTLTNTLTLDTFIADYMIIGNFYDIINFDSKKAFEKLLHVKFMQKLTNKRERGCALK